MIRLAHNATALGMLLVVSASVKDLARLLGGEVLLTLHGLGLGTFAITAGALLVPTAFVPTAFVHGFRHYIVGGENHDTCSWTYR